MDQPDKEVIREQFGTHAAAYVTSKPHAKGASLARLVELINAQPEWKVLDIACAAGHTAFVFAPHVAHVWATDITPEMLDTAREQVQERGLGNITVEYADAEDLPYEKDSFDLVTCRIAPHHFGNIGLFLRQARRVLRPGGYLAVVDNVLPPGSTGDYINAFEKLRDPSHNLCLSMDEWLGAFTAADLSLVHSETLDKQMTFEDWAARHNAVMQRYLRALLDQAPPGARTFLQPQTINSRTTFRLQEGIIIGRI